MKHTYLIMKHPVTCYQSMPAAVLVTKSSARPDLLLGCYAPPVAAAPPAGLLTPYPAGPRRPRCRK